MSDLRAEIKEAERTLEMKRRQLENLERNCAHKWGPTTESHIRREGYHVLGDPPGTMGVDRQLGFYVPAQVKQRWSRTCSVCGKVEYTSNVDVQKITTPRF